MEEYNKLAEKVMGQTIHHEQSDVKTMDPILISIIAKIIWEVVKCYINKKLTEEQALKMLQSPNFLQKNMLRLLVKKNIKKYKPIGKVNKGVLSEIVTNELIEAAQTATSNDVVTLALAYNPDQFKE